MSRLTAYLFLISTPAVLVSLPIQHQHQSPAMLVSLPTLHQGHLRQESSSSKLVRMYHQQQAATDLELEWRPKKLTRSVTPRRLPPLNPDPSLSSGVSPTSVEERKVQSTSPKPTKSHSVTHQKQQKGLRAQLRSEVQLQFERQHAFEVSLEQMLMEVEHGADWAEEEEEKQKKVGKDSKNPRWQKIWYKRLG